MSQISRIIAVALVLLPAWRAGAQIYSLQTIDLRLLYYSKAHEYVVPHLARCFENALSFDRRLFRYTPSEEITIFLEDFDDYGHGGTDVIPTNHMDIGLAPFNYVYETVPANERMNWLMMHELMHVVACDEAAGTDRFFRSLFFGKVTATPEAPLSMFYTYLTTPRRYSPRWYHEGIAVFMETWMSGGMGRVLGGYDEMVFRSMVRDSSTIYDVVGLESEGTAIDFQVGVNSYLYGTRFMSYLASQYGPDALLTWVTRTEGSSRFFATQFQQVYGRTLDEEWGRWIDFEHRWQDANLDSIRLGQVTAGRPLSERALGSVSRAFYLPKERTLYAAVRYPAQVAHIAAIDVDRGTMNKVCDVKGPALFYVASLAFDPRSGTLFYTANNNKWRDLCAADRRTGSSRTLLPEARIGDLAFDPADSSLWGVRHDNGFSTIVRIPSPYTEWNQVLTWPFGKDIFDLDVSPDGSLLVAGMAEINGTQRLISMSIPELLRGDSTYEVLQSFEKTSVENFVFSQDGRYLYGSTYYSGVSNLVRYDLAAKQMQWMTNGETGFFRPVPVSDDSLIAFQYTGQGFQPVWLPNRPIAEPNAVNYLGMEIVDRYPVVTSWVLDPPSPRRINIDSLTTYSGEYNSLGQIRLLSAYPVIEGYKDAVAFGMRINAGDPLGLHDLNFTATYSPAASLSPGERFHLSLNYSYWNWKFRATMNGADFYDLFGPTKVSRKGYSAGVTLKQFLIWDEPRTMEYLISVDGYSGLERLPDFQNISVGFDKFLTLNGALNYRYYIRTLGAVDAEQGIGWNLRSSNTLVRKTFYPLVHGGVDYGMMLPMDHSSIWLRGSAGYSPRDPGDPFANFYFGGFGNNWIDYQPVKRYRDFTSFPGIGLNAAGGATFGKLLAEVSLPPVRFRRAGILNAYCTWMHFTLFSAGLATGLDRREPQTEYLDVGSQVDFRLVLFSNLESTFSLGYAAAWRRDQRMEREFMISLKLL